MIWWALRCSSYLGVVPERLDVLMVHGRVVGTGAPGGVGPWREDGESDDDALRPRQDHVTARPAERREAADGSARCTVQFENKQFNLPTLQDQYLRCVRFPAGAEPSGEPDVDTTWE